MKTIAAGLISLSVLLVAQASADPGGGGWGAEEYPVSARSHRHDRHAPCVTDFWGNCTGVQPRNGCATDAGDNNCNGISNRHGHYHRHGYCVTDTWGNCTGVYRRRPAWRYIRQRHHDRDRDHHHHSSREERYSSRDEGAGRGPLCHPKRRIVGEERGTRAGAQKSADDSWMGAVRYDHGERYQDLNNAKGIRLNCDPSSVTGVLKRTRFRCVLEATPCRAAPGASEDRVERRYDEDSDDRK